MAAFIQVTVLIRVKSTCHPLQTIIKTPTHEKQSNVMWTGHEIYIFTYELPTYIRMWLDIYRYTEKLKHKKKPTGEVNIIDHVVQMKCCHLTCSGQPDTKKTWQRAQGINRISRLPRSQIDWAPWNAPERVTSTEACFHALMDQSQVWSMMGHPLVGLVRARLTLILNRIGIWSWF